MEEEERDHSRHTFLQQCKLVVILLIMFKLSKHNEAFFYRLIDSYLT